MNGKIFISYRRDGAEAQAQIIYDRLVARGKTVFYDVESLKAGAFDTKLYMEIEKCDNFVIIVNILCIAKKPFDCF